MDITVENIATLDVPEDLRTAFLDKYHTDAVPLLGTKGFFVKPQTEYETALATATKTAADAAVELAINGEAAKFYGGADALVTLITGETKPDKMRSRDWYNDLQKRGKFAYTDDVVTKVKAAIQGGGGSQGEKDQAVKDLETALEAQKTERQQDTQKQFNRRVNSTVNESANTLAVLISPEIKEPDKIEAATSAAQKVIADMIRSQYEFKESDDFEQLVAYKKGTNTAMMKGTRPMTVAEIAQQEYSYLLKPVGHKQPGVDSKNPDPSKAKVPATPETGFTNLAEVRYHAAKVLGYVVGTKEYDDFIKEQTPKIKKQ